MQIDCHVHTALHSGCAIMNPDEVCQTALQCGLSGVVFTEHHVLWSRAELDKLEAKYPKLHLYGGVEWSISEGYDIIAISKAPLPQIALFAPLEDVLEKIEAIRDDTILISAHPFRFVDRIDEGLDRVFRVCDAIEVASGNILRAGFFHLAQKFVSNRANLYSAAAQHYDLIPLYNSDGHMQEALGTFANIYPDVSMGSQDWLVDYLRTVRPKQLQNPERIRMYLQRKGCL